MLLYVSPPVGTGNSSQPQPETLYLFPDPVPDGLSALFIRFRLLICRDNPQFLFVRILISHIQILCHKKILSRLCIPHGSGMIRRLYIPFCLFKTGSLLIYIVK